MIIVDAHQDLAYNALCFDRDYRQSVQTTRAREAGGPVVQATGTCIVGLPELLEGGVALVFGTLFTMPARRPIPKPGFVLYQDAEQAHSQAMTQLDFYHRWADEHPQLSLVQAQADLERVLASWPGETDQRQVGLVTLMENAEPIRSPAEVETWVERGLRIVGPAWAGNRYTGGTGEPGPLTDEGRALLNAMADWGLGLDLSHMAEQAAFEALDRYDGPLLASHSNPRHFVPSDRHLSDDLIRAIAERDGVIGVVLFNRFLKRDWSPAERKELVTLNHVVDVIDYVCQLVGDAAHVGLGSDFDGGLGREAVPAEIDTVADLSKIAGLLAERGFAPQHVSAIMGGNWIDLLRRILPD